MSCFGGERRENGVDIYSGSIPYCSKKAKACSNGLRSNGQTLLFQSSENGNFTEMREKMWMPRKKKEQKEKIYLYKIKASIHLRSFETYLHKANPMCPFVCMSVLFISSVVSPNEYRGLLNEARKLMATSDWNR